MGVSPLLHFSTSVFLAFIMTLAVAKAAADLIDAGPMLATVIATLGWIIVLARLGVTGFELWELYFEPPGESTR